ncbi:MAG: N-acetyltransferase [Magnetococcales bacterium]|nr:N-acetyltransferase [Magnetococcales bacterium]
MKLKLYSTITKIDKTHWNTISGSEFPFSEYDFLLTLEKSGSVGRNSGWHPLYLTLWQEKVMLGANILYSKTNSYGEYIFDWQWAQAYQAHGQDYYPKIVSAIPFTPATGHKLLLHPNADRGMVVSRLIAGAKQLVNKMNCQSLHYLFIHPSELADFHDNGMVIRHSVQFHWRNQNYDSFDGFLARLKSRKRKQIIKERQEVQKSGITITRLSGEQLNDEHASIMAEFYLDTIKQKQAIPYLSKLFFKQIFKIFSHNIILILASHNGNWVAGALSFCKGGKLFGRYWGCNSQYRYLHFELCYYQLIEIAINSKIRMVEAGAQGPHKVQRGFLPELTYSAHHIEDSDFKKAINQYITIEKKHIWAELEDMRSYSPYRVLVD